MTPRLPEERTGQLGAAGREGSDTTAARGCAMGSGRSSTYKLRAGQGSGVFKGGNWQLLHVWAERSGALVDVSGVPQFAGQQGEACESWGFRLPTIGEGDRWGPSPTTGLERERLAAECGAGTGLFP